MLMRETMKFLNSWRELLKERQNSWRFCGALGIEMVSLRPRGLDSRQSWIIAILCGLLHLFCSLSMVSMGSIFTGLLEDFSQEREKASWPVTAITCSMQIVSPVFSLLVHLKVPHTWILRVCTFTTSAGLVLCYFAEDIVHMTILLAIHGASLAGIFMSANVLMAGHFRKQRTAATGVQEGIAGVSVFFMPAFMDEIIRRFRTSHGTSVLGLVTAICFFLSLCIMPFKEERSDENYHDPTRVVQMESPGDASSGDPTQPTDLSNGDETSQLDASSVGIVLDGRKKVEEEPKPFSWRIFVHPFYLFDVFSFLVVFECYASFLQLTADYSRDREVPEVATWLVPIFGLGDMVLKIGSGFLSDAKIMSPPTLMLTGSLIQCFGFVFLSRASTALTLCISALMMGISNGCRIILFIIVLINDFGLENLSHTFSFANFFIGIATLIKPFLVGYFRDHLGEYLGLFLVLAAMNAVTAIYWTGRLVHNYRKQQTH